MVVLEVLEEEVPLLMFWAGEHLALQEHQDKETAAETERAARQTGVRLAAAAAKVAVDVTVTKVLPAMVAPESLGSTELDTAVEAEAEKVWAVLPATGCTAGQDFLVGAEAAQALSVLRR